MPAAWFLPPPIDERILAGVLVRWRRGMLRPMLAGIAQFRSPEEAGHRLGLHEDAIVVNVRAMSR